MFSNLTWFQCKFLDIMIVMIVTRYINGSVAFASNIPILPLGKFFSVLSETIVSRDELMHGDTFGFCLIILSNVTCY